MALASCDVSHILDDDLEPTTLPPPPKPYLFSYTAGRFPGHNDRAHTEVSDGKGTVRGAFSFIDPTQNIRSVEYVADKDGFRPILSHPLPEPKQSEAVQRATNNHINLYNRIAEAHAHPDEVIHYLFSLARDQIIIMFFILFTYSRTQHCQKTVHLLLMQRKDIIHYLIELLPNMCVLARN